MTGIASSSSTVFLYISSIIMTSSSASSFVLCTVWPSCHKNSEVLNKSFVDLISARNAEFQKLILSGKSLQLFIHLEYMEYASVSEVGLKARRSPISASPEWVTQNTSGLNPAKRSASLLSKDSGIRTGRKAFS